MSEKNLRARIVNKHDIESNWLKSSFVPKQGEIIVYDIEVDSDGNTLTLPSGRTEPYAYERIKVGDGIHNVNDLPFVNDALKDLLESEIGSVDDKVDAVSALVGDSSVSDQISTALVSSQADWSQNDDTASDYIKNKPAIPAATLLVVTVDASNKASHTAAEINTFVQSGGSAVLVWFSNVFHAKIITASKCQFGTMFNATTGATEWIMNVDANGTATFSDVVCFAIKNPNPITFTGTVNATYDGSSAVSIDIPSQVVDSELSSDSTNPVQNKIINEEISNLHTLIGDTSVSEQINIALDGSRADWNQTNEEAFDYIKNKPLVATDADVMDFLAEMSYITPVSNADGSIYANEQGQVYTI